MADEASNVTKTTGFYFISATGDEDVIRATVCGAVSDDLGNGIAVDGGMCSIATILGGRGGSCDYDGYYRAPVTHYGSHERTTEGAILTEKTRNSYG